MNIHYNKVKNTRNKINKSWHFIQKQWFNAVLIYLACHVIYHKNIRIEFGQKETVGVVNTMSVLPASYNSGAHQHVKKGGKAGFSIGNLTPILSPDYGERKGIPKSVIKAKVKVCRNYVKQYAPVAVMEMEM